MLINECVLYVSCVRFYFLELSASAVPNIVFRLSVKDGHNTVSDLLGQHLIVKTKFPVTVSK